MPQSSVFSRILVPLDGSNTSEQALGYAAALAGPDTVTTLLHVDVPTGATAAVMEALVASQTGELPVEDERQAAELAETAARWKPAFEGEVQSSAVFGDPVTEILAASVASDIDLIVTATHGHSLLGRWAFGSVADDLARASSVPVLIVRAHEVDDAAIEPATFSRIVFPYDGSEFARAPIPLIAALANERGIPVHIVAAYQVSPAAPISTGMDAGYPISTYAEMQVELEDIATESADAATAAFKKAGIDVTNSVHFGSTAYVIEDALTAGDLVVMVSHGRGGVERALLGSIADKLIRDGKAPVLLVPAPDRDDESMPQG